MSNIADKTISEWLEERRASERKVSPPPPAKTSWFWKIIGWSFVANLAIFGGMAIVNLLVSGPAIVVMLCLGVAAYLCDPYHRPKPRCGRRASQIRPSQSG
ncbi:hypothetical protein HS125_20695 [bacterium]|nr:hypothetical protein [bacterium]